MTDKEIYVETQLLAQKLASYNGFEIDSSDFSSTTDNAVIDDFWQMAVISQEHLNSHEMQDIVGLI